MRESATPATTAGTAAAPAEVSTHSDEPPSADAGAGPGEPAAAQGLTPGSEAAEQKPGPGTGEHSIAAATTSKAGKPLSEPAAEDADSRLPDSSSAEQGDTSEPEQPDEQRAVPAVTQRTGGSDGGAGDRSGAAKASQRPEEADNARKAARQGAQQYDPRSVSDGKPRSSKAPKHRKAPKERTGAANGSKPASKPEDAQLVSPAPDAAQTAEQQAPAREDAQPATAEAGLAGGDQAASAQRAEQPATAEHAAPAQQSEPATAAQASPSRYSSHDPGADREGTWSSYRALPNMHEAHPHYQECVATVPVAAGTCMLVACSILLRRHTAPQSCTAAISPAGVCPSFVKMCTRNQRLA